MFGRDTRKTINRRIAEDVEKNFSNLRLVAAFAPPADWQDGNTLTQRKNIMIIAKDTTGDKFPKLPLPEAGTTQAVCCAVWDLGLQKSTYMGKERIQHKIIIAWEIVEKINAPESEYHGKPYMLNRKYTLSLSEKANLRQDLEGWRGHPFTAEELESGFDIEKLYGVNCYIGIKHEPNKNDSTIVYANVSAILPLPKGVEKIMPLRPRDEAPPKWVIEKQAQAFVPDDQPAPDYDFPAYTENQDDQPF